MVWANYGDTKNGDKKVALQALNMLEKKVKIDMRLSENGTALTKPSVHFAHCNRLYCDTCKNWVNSVFFSNNSKKNLSNKKECYFCKRENPVEPWWDRLL